MQVDPQFQQARDRARRRRNKRLIKRIGLFGVLPACLILAGVWFFTDIGQNFLNARDDGFALTQIESDIVVAPVTTASGFIDIAGDPMILRFSEDTAKTRTKAFAGPPVLDISRFSLPKPDRIVLIQDDLFVRERRLITTLPSTREDFAFFQAQRSRSLTPSAGTAVASQPGAAPDVDLGNLSDSYGVSLETGGDRQGPKIEKTRIENNTSVTFIRRESARETLFEDIIIQTEATRNFADILANNGFSDAVAARLSSDIATVLPVDKPLAVGSIIGLRVRPAGQQKRLLQMSLYAPTGYLGSVAQIGRNRIVASADPWIEKDLMAFSARPDEGGGANAGQYRLLDALYSAAIRNGVPTQLVGEIVVMMSKTYDLDSMAQAGDQLTLLYSKEHGPNGQAEGQILFVGIRGTGGDRPCYVVPDKVNGGFNCYAPNARYAPAGGVIKAPVAGIMTSKFGPRNHPILKTVRLHTGVDWAAPTGTPIYAAADGQVSFAGDGKGYGNLVIIAHSGGLETRYAHMDKFAPAAKQGTQVRAGELIGYVGTTGRSTGPHLHFEVRKDAKPVDPIPYMSGGNTAVASSSVEQLVNQIIRVESAGNATARNSRSTATGLGQFIESTWLRMMRTYRPDLASAMSRADLLALRTDPTLSRTMVKRLAQENEAYLRARGHNPTSGQLYLAHFLGPGGADTVLSADDNLTIAALMGQGVIKANPFLKNYTVAKLKGWADRKMHSKGAASAPARAVVPASAEVKLFKATVDEMLRQNS